jgi:hypothetical protein
MRLWPTRSITNAFSSFHPFLLQERQKQLMLYRLANGGHKKTQPQEAGDMIPAPAPSPSKGFSSQKTKQVSWLAASAYSLRLPKAFVSVAHADFVPLTVAGQRGVCTLFPNHSAAP